MYTYVFKTAKLFQRICFVYSYVELLFKFLIFYFCFYRVFSLKETVDGLATANGVRWYGHVLKRHDYSVLIVALNLEVSGKRKRGRPKKTRKKLMKEQAEKIGLIKKVPLNNLRTGRTLLCSIESSKKV